MPSRPGFAIAALAVSSLAALGFAEITVRLTHPTPRLQIVRPDVADDLQERDGTVVWTMDEPRIVSNACAEAPEGDLRVTFVGSSIFRGSGVAGEATFTTQLQERSAGYCVDNVSQPAFTAGQKRVVALQALNASSPPDLIFWEVWTNDLDGYTLIDGVAYNLAHVHTDAAGRPDAFGLPAVINGALFRHSQLFHYASLTLAAEDRSQIDVKAQWRELLRDELLPVVERAAATGTEIVLVTCPRLDQPFNVSTSRPPRAYGTVWPFAQEHGLTWFRLAQHLEDLDVAEARADLCCHFSETGHQALAELFEQQIRQRIP